MKITELYSKDKPVISFEFFPPKTDEAEEKLFETVKKDFKPLNPSFISVTYGAMGSTRANTLRIVSRIKNEIGIEAAAHLTCVGQTQIEIEEILTELKASNIQNIVALRGDPPQGEVEFKPIEGGFQYASELVAFIRSKPEFASHFSLAVAGYPEGHQECPDYKKGLEHLKHKVEQGADLIVSQLFFDNQDFFKFVDDCRTLGMKLPIVAGIMPITQGPQIQRIAKMCGAKIPQVINDAIQKYGDDQASIKAFGIEYAAQQCEELLKKGVAGIHFYTLNQSDATRKIYQSLSL